MSVSVMSGNALALGVDILLTSPTVATGKRGPVDRRLAGQVRRGACGLPGVDGLVLRSNRKLADADTASSHSPAKSGTTLTSRVIAKTVSAEDHARAACGLPENCEG
ncbi:hypothetical protein AB0G86_34180 [Streptomyces scabiei]|uniref:hypothetical protein n=1 Tax=Streptomyces scabiei TaxID=1930 RepID=UPI0033EE0228